MTLSVFDAAREAPERVALVAGKLTLTFDELGARVLRRLAELGEAGALDPRGERPVAVVARPTLAVVETLFALAAAGTPALLLHARLTDGEQEALTRFAGAVAEPPPAPPAVTEPASVKRTAPPVDLVPFDPERIAALVPTSGSTGVPRIVRLSHRAFLAAGRLTAERFGIESDRSLLALPLAHIGGLGMLFRCLLHRTALVLFEPRRSMLAELDRLAAAVVEQRVTIVSLVPTLLARLLEPPLAWRPPSSLRLVLLGGAPTPRELVERARAAGVPVVPTYGMTETCASAVLGRYAERLTPPPRGGEILASGSPGLGVEQRLVNGLLEVRGDTLFSGYLGGPEHSRGAWLATNDRAFLDAHGELVVTGRASDMIITGGENVDPAEVEAALTALPEVALACVFGLPDPTFGEVVTALVVLNEGAVREANARALTASLERRLASYKRPRRIELVRSLPLTAAGKLDRRAARATLIDNNDLPGHYC
ncbi:MAG TPA: class I adenylate-forming enzyme family protein [Polyangiaceae bacterium]|nr:class I adenylate-forming enzyme family protein [Polyangiaceae bacterium]